MSCFCLFEFDVSNFILFKALHKRFGKSSMLFQVCLCLSDHLYCATKGLRDRLSERLYYAAYLDSFYALGFPLR